MRLGRLGLEESSPKSNASKSRMKSRITKRSKSKRASRSRN